MTDEIGVLLPVRIETRFKNGNDLWIRVVPDEPWFVRDDPSITAAELAAITRFAAAPPPATGLAPMPPSWSELCAQVGAGRAVYLHRTFVTVASDGTATVTPPTPDQLRSGPALPRIVGFPTQLSVWADDASGRHEILTLTVDRSRLLADFADPDVSGDRRWWQDWDEAVAVGVAGVVPAASLMAPIDAVYVIGLGDGDPGELFGAVAAEGRMGLLAPGLPTNSVDGAPAAPLANDPATWWNVLHAAPGSGDTDVALALTGDASRLGSLPGGATAMRGPASTLVTALWPALWGFAAAQVFDIARGPQPARWAASTLFPEGAYPSLRIGPQPYGLLPVTAWSMWTPDTDDPAFEPALITALLRLRSTAAGRAHTRGTAVGTDTAGLLDLIADTPSSREFRFRAAWPLELWWLAGVSSGLPIAWRQFAGQWSSKIPLAAELGVLPLRRYAARGAPRRVSLPLVLPPGTAAGDLPALLGALADAAVGSPATFASTAGLANTVLDGRDGSLLLRLAVRSLQLAVGDLRRERLGGLSFDPEPYSRNSGQPGRLETLITGVAPADATGASDAAAQLRTVADAVRALGAIAEPELDRRLRATVDAAGHRLDPWLVAAPQRRLDALIAAGATRRLGAYGWVDGPAPGHPGPTAAGLLHTPSPSTALAAAVLRDRAVSDPSPRWDLTITSATARAAGRLAEEVRAGAHLFEVLGREVERIVGSIADVEVLRRAFPVRTEHAGRRVCNGLQVLAQNPFPLSLDAEQTAAITVLRAAADTYGDLLVVDAVHHLVEGRADIAGEIMDAAAGMSQPPDLGLLRTARSGRGVSSSVVLALPAVVAPPWPTDAAARAVVSPAAVLDPSVAAYLAARTGDASAWDFQVTVIDAPTSPARTVTVTLADLGLTPADALTLALTTLQRLAVEAATGGVVAGSVVTGGSGSARYEQAAALVGLIGRSPAELRALAEQRTTAPPGEPLPAELVDRYSAVLDTGAALAGELRAQVNLLTPTGDIGGADAARLRQLLIAATGWGIAPDPPGTVSVSSVPTDSRAADQLAARAALTLTQIDDRLGSAPAADVAVALGRSGFLAAAGALIAPTGQVSITSIRAAAELPALTRAPDLDVDWLTVVAAVRPTLAQLEAYQLAALAPSVDSSVALPVAPFAAWTNRAADPWQADATDARSLVAIYADPQLDLAALPSGGAVAQAAVDQFDEVVPDAAQVTGAAFGFDAPAARAQQAILLAIPPVTGVALDVPTVAQILVETRELVHARMARPSDLDDQFWGLLPSALLPATGAIATPLGPLR